MKTPYKMFTDMFFKCIIRNYIFLSFSRAKELFWKAFPSVADFAKE